MKKKIAYWALYDFANSIVMIAFLFYFSQWLVIDRGRPAWWYNGALILSSLLFVLSAPYLSKKIDTQKAKIAGLRIWSLFTFLGFASVSLLAVLSEGKELLTTVIFSLATYTYLICFLYFTPMLNDLSNKENRSWVSGLGQGANSIGQVTGVLITLPFVNGITLLGDPGRAQALLPATVIFGFLILPLLFLYKEDKTQPNYSNAMKPNILSMFKSIFSHKPLAFLFLAYFLFSDALITFANNFPLYLETVHGVSDTIKSILTAAILVLAAMGAVIFGKISDKKGDLKTLKWIILLWCVLFGLMAFITNFKLLVPIFMIAGIIFGPVWAISRSMVGRLSHPDLLASSYSYYVVAERFATFIGPLIWSIALVVMGEGVRGYQTALIALGIVMVISLFALSKIKESDKPQNQPIDESL